MRGRSGNPAKMKTYLSTMQRIVFQPIEFGKEKSKMRKNWDYGDSTIKGRVGSKLCTEILNNDV